MRYCNRTKQIIESSYVSMSVSEICEAIKNAKLTERTPESIALYIEKLKAKRELTKEEQLEILSTYNPCMYRAKTLYYGARTRAKHKGIDFDLTIEWIYTRLKKGKCEATGLKFNVKIYKSGYEKINPYAPSLDQIEPSGGYTKDNVQVVVDFYNKMKNDRSDIETVNFAWRIINSHVKKHGLKIT